MDQVNRQSIEAAYIDDTSTDNNNKTTTAHATNMHNSHNNMIMLVWDDTLKLYDSINTLVSTWETQ